MSIENLLYSDKTYWKRQREIAYKLLQDKDAKASIEHFIKEESKVESRFGGYGECLYNLRDPF